MVKGKRLQRYLNAIDKNPYDLRLYYAKSGKERRMIITDQTAKMDTSTYPLFYSWVVF